MLWRLEACNGSLVLRQLIGIGRDAWMGQFFRHPGAPVTETQPHSAYPGCSALFEVLGGGDGLDAESSRT